MPASQIRPYLSRHGSGRKRWLASTEDIVSCSKICWKSLKADCSGLKSARGVADSEAGGMAEGEMRGVAEREEGGVAEHEEGGVAEREEGGVAERDDSGEAERCGC